MDKAMMVIGAIVIGFILAVVLGILFCFPVMWAWNYVMPYMFGFKVITWQQAWCLSFLSSMMLKPSYTKS